MIDTTPSTETEPEPESELDRLKSRLAQGKRDHQRSHDELLRLEAHLEFRT